MRVEAVKQLTGARALDALILATHDNDPEVQIEATDGLVNFYLPGYVQTGLGGFHQARRRQHQGPVHRYQRPGGRPVRHGAPDAVAAIGALARGGGSMQARANAARAVGILRGKAAVPDLLEALRTKDTDVLYESLVALQKIRDESAGPKITFLLRDLNAKVQIAAIETTGLLRNREAAPDLIERPQAHQGRQGPPRGAGSLAMLADPAGRPVSSST